MAFWTVAYLGIRPLASLIDGTAATLFGLRFAAFLMTVPTLIGAVMVFRLIARTRSSSPVTESEGHPMEIPGPPEQQLLGEQLPAEQLTKEPRGER